MCGVLAAMFEHYKEAQTFLERATSIDPHSVVAWTLLGEMKVCIPSYCCLPCDRAPNTGQYRLLLPTLCCQISDISQSVLSTPSMMDDG